MKSIISILLFITLPFVISGEKTSQKYEADVAILNKMAKKQSIINKVLKLKEDGFLGEGHTGFVYQGNYMLEERKYIDEQDKKVQSGTTVAIKFVPEAKSSQAKREYEIYTYLKAYKKPEVEKYGIPTVYYHGKWKKFTLTALTKLDMDADHIACMEHQFKNPLDVLILIRDFIYQLKYIHSCGVRHDDINPVNIMVRGHKSFLIDFEMGSKMTENNCNGSIGFGARKTHLLQPRVAMDDLESFFYTICHLLRCPMKWFCLKPLEIDITEIFQLTWELKSRTDNILDCVDRCIKDGSLKMVIYELAKEIYADPPEAFPDYNRLFELVNGEISKLRVKTKTLLPIFSWLTDAQKDKAARELYSQPPLDIEDIVDPKPINFTTFVYPVVKHV